MTTIVLALDPGTRGCGVSLFDRIDHGDLIAAAYVANSMKRGNGPAECLTMAREVERWVRSHVARADVDMVTEWPRIYTTQKQAKDGKWRDPNDLLALTGVACALAALVSPVTAVTRYFPDEWKGQTSKGVMNTRSLERLTEAERSRIVDAGELSHNIYDALGIGLKRVGRLEKRRVYAR